MGRLVKIRVDKQWIEPGVKQEQGVTSQGLQLMGAGQCPTRYRVGDKILHYRTKKPGIVVEASVGDGTPKTHRYGVVFEGTVQQRQCGMATLRPARNVDFKEPHLTSCLKAQRSVFNAVATCMSREKVEPEVWGTEHVCSCREEEESTEKRTLTTVPHTRHILLNGHCPYALIDTGAGPNLVRTNWLDTVRPGWKSDIDRTGVTTTRFKLADGGRSAAPAGQIRLKLMVGGQLIEQKFWVLKDLTTNMIIGSKMLSSMGAVIDYSKNEVRSKRYPQMDAVPFDLSQAEKWRYATSVTALSDIVLRPNTVEVVVGGISTTEMQTLTHGETDFGGVVPVTGMGDRGVEVKHTLQAVSVEREKGRSVGRLNVLLQNANTKAVLIKKGEVIGGYLPQCEQGEDRYGLASVSGLKLATALGLKGTGLLESLRKEVPTGGGEKETTQDGARVIASQMSRFTTGTSGVDMNRTKTQTARCLVEALAASVRQPHRANVDLEGLVQKHGGRTEEAEMRESMLHTTHTKDESVKESEFASRSTCEFVSRENARKSSDKHPSKSRPHCTQKQEKVERMEKIGQVQTHGQQGLLPQDSDPVTTQWDNSSEDIDRYTSPPKIRWSDAEVERVFLQEPFKGLDLEEAELDHAGRLQLKRLIIQYRCLFEPQEKATVRGYEVRVDVKPGAQPAVGRMYRQSHQNDKLLKQWIDKAVKDGLIEPSTSPWRAGVLCIPKNNGQQGLEGIRVVHSFVLLNKVLEPVSWPLPRVNDLLNDIAGSQYLSALDLSAAFHQLPVEEGEAQDRLTFCTRHGLYRFKSLPMGLSTASSWFQRFADMVIGDLRYQRGPANEERHHVPGVGESESKWWEDGSASKTQGCACMFIDDIAVRSQTVQGHLQDLAAVFDRLAKFRCQLKLRKSKFFRRKITFLGHVVSRDGIESDPRKVQAIDAFTLDRMQTPRDITVFLQTASFMRKFIRNFSQISAPLAKYQRKGAKGRFKKGLEGDEEARAAFEEIKSRLKSAPVLAPADYGKPWEVWTDGSGCGLGSALIQRDEDGLARVVMYASRALKDNELSYSTYELEFLAGKFAFNVFHEYIAGGKVTWYTDHAALQAVDRQSKGRTQRWLADLMAIDFRVVFVPGKKNTLPDGLSRFPILGPSIYDAETESALTMTKVGSDRPAHLTTEEGRALIETRARGSCG